MAACVESLFYVNADGSSRNVPWHGLGTPVKEAPTSHEAIRLAGLDWNVESRPIFDAFGKEIPGYIANTRDKDNSVLGIVSTKYQIVQNSNAFEFTDNLISDEVRYETAGSLKDGRVVWLLAKMPEKHVLDDAIEPYICFTNTHDGSGAVRVCLTPIRVVCNNTLNYALETATRCWSTRHMGNVESKLAEARETLSLTNYYMEELNKKAEELVKIKLTDDKVFKLIDNIYPIDSIKDADRKIRNVIDIKDRFMQCYNMPDVSNYKGTAWGVALAATDYADHAIPNRMTTKYQENTFGKILGGHPFVDNIYKQLIA